MQQLKLWPNDDECSCERCTCDANTVSPVGHYPVAGEIQDTVAKECTCIECDCGKCHNEKIEYYWECNVEELLDSDY